MTGLRKGRRRIWRAAVLMAAVTLGACGEEGALPFGAGAGGGAVAPTGGSVQLVERDVEAPEIFSVTEAGLWDGRPSLGGVWVAHPDVTEPERVIIRNQANGSFVIGALFRRERENPGPALQVSSDAAAALNMLAGAPATLNVTALRREEAAAPAATEANTGAIEGEGMATFEAPDAVATATLDAVPAAPAVAASVLPDPEEPQVPGAVALANAIAIIEGRAPAPAPVSAPAPAAAPAPAPAAAPTPTPAPAPAAAPAGAPSRPYIQVGIFSVEANANNTAVAMRNAGLTATVRQDESQGRTFWRVLVGPAGSESERARLLDQVKALGFTDAYFVRN